MSGDADSGNGLILGCGYVGCAVARQWLRAGIRVWGVSRNPETLSTVREQGFHPVVAAVDSDDWHGRVPLRCEWVLNCVSSAGGGLEGYRRSYVGGNESLIRWLESAEARRIVYTSSTAVYPFTDGREVFEEDSGGDLSDSGRLVLESEEILRKGKDAAGLATILRLAGIYGPGRHYLLDSLREGKTVFPGRGDYFLNLIHRDDIVGAIGAVLAEPATEGRIFNVSDGSPARKEEVTGWLADQIGVDRPVFDPSASGRRMRINAAGHPPNRRIRVDRLREAAGWAPRYPDFRTGFEAILRETAPGEGGV